MIDDDLRNLVAADAPPARDPAFELAVMARIERRQFHHALLQYAGISLVLALVLAFAAPMLQQIWQRESTATGNLLAGISLLLVSYLMLRLTRAEN